MLAGIKRACDLDSEQDHCKFKALLREDVLGALAKNSQGSAAIITEEHVLRL